MRRDCTFESTFLIFCPAAAANSEISTDIGTCVCILNKFTLMSSAASLRHAKWVGLRDMGCHECHAKYNDNVVKAKDHLGLK